METTSNGKRKRPWRRIVAGILAVVFLILGCVMIWDGRRRRDRFEAAKYAEPVRMNVDLSQPGEYTGKFLHTYDGACSYVFLVEVDPTPFNSTEEAMRVGEKIRGSLRVATLDGRLVLKRKLTPDHFGGTLYYPPDPPPTIPAFHLYVFVTPFAEGRYRLSVNVVDGASELAGVRQTLVARYDPIPPVGYLYATFIWAGGIGCFIVAGCMIMGIFIVSRRRRA